ncbi:MAG: HEPN domain-containing [Geobacteraceae bacterium]|nr:MAG: HEPN domain-containing [Geobacteraceae bacterium]
MSAIDNARMLLDMAAKDIRAMTALADPESVDDEIFGFHAQQAVEKSLKAWLTSIGGTYGRIHDLSQLFALLTDLGCEVKRFEDLDMLNPFAVELRYEALETGEPKLDRSSCMIRVQELYDHVRQIFERIA